VGLVVVWTSTNFHKVIINVMLLLLVLNTPFLTSLSCKASLEKPDAKSRANDRGNDPWGSSVMSSKHGSAFDRRFQI